MALISLGMGVVAVISGNGFLMLLAAAVCWTIWRMSSGESASEREDRERGWVLRLDSAGLSYRAAPTIPWGGIAAIALVHEYGQIQMLPFLELTLAPATYASIEAQVAALASGAQIYRLVPARNAVRFNAGALEIGPAGVVELVQAAYEAHRSRGV